MGGVLEVLRWSQQRCGWSKAHAGVCMCERARMRMRVHARMYVLREDPFALAGIFHAANRHQLQIHWPGLSEALLICTFAN